MDQGGSRMMPVELFRHGSSSSVRPKAQPTQEKSYGLRMTRAQPLILEAIPPGSEHKDRIYNAFVLLNLAIHLQKLKPLCASAMCSIVSQAFHIPPTLCMCPFFQLDSKLQEGVALPCSMQCPQLLVQCLSLHKSLIFIE